MQRYILVPGPETSHILYCICSNSVTGSVFTWRFKLFLEQGTLYNNVLYILYISGDGPTGNGKGSFLLLDGETFKPKVHKFGAWKTVSSLQKSIFFWFYLLSAGNLSGHRQGRGTVWVKICYVFPEIYNILARIAVLRNIPLSFTAIHSRIRNNGLLSRPTGHAVWRIQNDDADQDPTFYMDADPDLQFTQLVKP